MTLALSSELAMPTPTAPQAYSPGLEGIIAGESAICQVDPNAGLVYRGYDVHDLAARSTFEDVAWLLLHGQLPTAAESEAFRQSLAAASPLPDPIKQALALFPKNMHSIDALRTGVSMLAPFDPQLDDNSHAANIAKSMRLIARVSSIITAAQRVRTGQEPLIALGENLPHPARFFFTLTGREPQAWQSTAMNTIFTLYAEHDFNASTFSARVTASTLADIYAAVTSAIGTLKGPLHGGANEAAIHVLEEVATPDRADAWVADRLARHEKIMGFGHRVYRTGDSRVPVMRNLLKQLGDQLHQPHWHANAGALEAAVLKQKGLYANVDLYAAPVLHLLGIPAELNTSIFAAARIAGWCAHVTEQHDHNRLIRPRSLYTGPAPRKLQ